MEYKAAQIAVFLNGTVEGNPDIRVSSLSKIEEGKAGTLSFLSNPKYTPYIYTTEASIILVNNDFAATQPITRTLIRVPDSYSAFAKLLEMFDQSKPEFSGISRMASVAASARIGEGVSVGDFSVIGNNALIGDHVIIFPQVFIGECVKIGENTVIYPGTKVYKNCVIGSNCRLHAGVVIGSDGFGFAPQTDGEFRKIPQVGNVVIEDNVEIGSNTTIDRATMGSTYIRKGVKLDNLIQVAHNVEIGENTAIAAQTGISGSTKIGKNCLIGGQVGIVGHLTIADNVKIGAQSGVEGSITREGAAVLGVPAIDIIKARKNLIHWRNLDEIVKKIYSIEKNLKTKHE
jgi:UDP-3-O-[3-hydroxymyristoyl] glucosamine N-acyltransferase